MKWKKEKKPYPRSFAKRLTWRIMLRMLIIMGIPSALVFWGVYAMVAVGALSVGNFLVRAECEEIRRITSDLHVASVNTAPVIEDCLNQPDKMVGIMERMLKKNPYIRSCGISFIDNYYPKKGRWFCPYAIRIDSTATETRILGDREHDYLSESWFKEALGRDKAYWGKPFFSDDDQQTPLVSYVTPIRDKQQRTVAVLGVDLSLDWLNEKVQFMRSVKRDTVDGKLEAWKAEYQIYFFITDTTGTLILHPDKERIGHKRFQDYVTSDPENDVKSILSLDDTDSDEIVIEDEDVMISSTAIKYLDWMIVFVIPEFYVNLFGYLVGGFMLFIIIVGLLVVYLFGRRTIKKSTLPIKQLAASANEVAKGNFTTQLPPLKSRDEIHMLRDSFEQMQQSLTRYVEELKTTTTQKASIESELKIAHNIQMAMLPKIFPPYPERSDIDIFGQLSPAKAVGGDLFDFYIHDEQLFFCVGDVSGKGVPASLFMAVTRSLFRNVSAHESEPQLIVQALNSSLAEGNEMNMFVTLFVGVLDLQSGLLYYCNAGHDAPLLISQHVSLLPCDPNLPIGIEADWQFSKQEILIQPHTTIFLFTDGLNEAENSRHEQFGDQRILGIAQSLSVTGDYRPTNVVGKMSEAVHSFVGNAEQSDDLTMLAIQYIK